ncbi:SH3 domain-containing protein [Niallia sp. JL1B1071]|uniref:SH3 domain-containing protein n=1 Tax=Niallia tiangongensis TaxID=3237105 RepID=UPI0037DD57D0
MKKNRRNILIGLSTVIIAVVLVLGFILSNDNKNGKDNLETSVNQSTKTVAKVASEEKAIEKPNDNKGDIDSKAEKTEVTKENEKKKQEENIIIDDKVESTEDKKVEVKKQTVEVKKTEEKTDIPAKKEPTTTVLEKPVTNYVDVSSLNVRSGAGTSYSVVTVVNQGQATTVVETSSNGWSKVKVNNKTGWVSSKYLSTKKTVVSESNAHKNTSTSTSTSTSDSKKPTTPTQSTPASNGNVADQLKTVDANHQLILVTTNGANTSSATIRTFEKDSKGKWTPILNISGYIGKKGFATPSAMSEGGERAPTGKYTIGTAFGRSNNPGTKLPYRKITSDDVWVDDPKSELYNTWQSKSKTKDQWNSAENMDIAAYNYGFVINYNTARTPNKGSAIFFHVSSSYTLGCTGTSQANVISILKWLDPAKNPVIIQTPVSELGNY